MHSATGMGQECYPLSLPTSTQHIRRRQHLPSTTRLIKYILFGCFLLLTIGIWKRNELTPTFSRYLPVPVDGTLEVVPEETSASSMDDSLFHASDLEPPLDSTERTSQSPYPKFGKVTASFGDPDSPYEAAIASHALHNEIHGYPHFILREHMIRGLWSKHGWIMTIIGQELAKPEDQRLKWLMWHDRDTVLMNPQIPLDIFVPPEPQFSNIHLVVTNDRNGLNNGVFMVRVSQWAFKLFASALSIREYQPDIPLKYTEQSGMEEAIKRVCHCVPHSQFIAILT